MKVQTKSKIWFKIPDDSLLFKHLCEIEDTSKDTLIDLRHIEDNIYKYLIENIYPVNITEIFALIQLCDFCICEDRLDSLYIYLASILETMSDDELQDFINISNKLFK